ncbi:MAG: hypothetical protein P4L49_19520 [Desulfosporosinus sp.]|nr:hypothetical protein [Desulfosporosinus sp.]
MTARIEELVINVCHLQMNEILPAIKDGKGGCLSLVDLLLTILGKDVLNEVCHFYNLAYLKPTILNLYLVSWKASRQGSYLGITVRPDSSFIVLDLATSFYSRFLYLSRHYLNFA